MILATSKPYAVPATARRNTISMQGSIDILFNRLMLSERKKTRGLHPLLRIDD